jgi:hypothetical protein
MMLLMKSIYWMTAIEPLAPCSRYISQLFIDRKYSAIIELMAPENALRYSMLLCLSLLSSDVHIKDKIKKNWHKFELSVQYLAYNDERIDRKDLKTMFYRIAE